MLLTYCKHTWKDWHIPTHIHKRWNSTHFSVHLWHWQLLCCVKASVCSVLYIGSVSVFVYTVYCIYSVHCHVSSWSPDLLVQAVDKDRLLINYQEKDVGMRCQLKMVMTCLSHSALQISQLQCWLPFAFPLRERSFHNPRVCECSTFSWRQHHGDAFKIRPPSAPCHHHFTLHYGSVYF